MFKFCQRSNAGATWDPERAQQQQSRRSKKGGASLKRQAGWVAPRVSLVRALTCAQVLFADALGGINGEEFRRFRERIVAASDKPAARPASAAGDAREEADAATAIQCAYRGHSARSLLNKSFGGSPGKQGKQKKKKKKAVTYWVDQEAFLQLGLAQWREATSKAKAILGALFTAGDVNGDGVFSFDEFCAVVRHIDPKLSTKKVMAIYRDADGGGGRGSGGGGGELKKAVRMEKAHFVRAAMGHGLLAVRVRSSTLKMQAKADASQQQGAGAGAHAPGEGATGPTSIGAGGLAGSPEDSLALLTFAWNDGSAAEVATWLRRLEGRWSQRAAANAIVARTREDARGFLEAQKSRRLELAAEEVCCQQGAAVVIQTAYRGATVRAAAAHGPASLLASGAGFGGKDPAQELAAARERVALLRRLMAPASPTQEDADAAWMCYRMLMVEVKKEDEEEETATGNEAKDEDSDDDSSDESEDDEGAEAEAARPSADAMEAAAEGIEGTAEQQAAARKLQAITRGRQERRSTRALAEEARAGERADADALGACTISADRATALVGEMRATPGEFNSILKRRVKRRIQSAMALGLFSLHGKRSDGLKTSLGIQ